MSTSAARRHGGGAAPEQSDSTGTTASRSQRYRQQASLEAFHTSPCARGTPALSVQAADTPRAAGGTNKSNSLEGLYCNKLLFIFLKNAEISLKSYL